MRIKEGDKKEAIFNATLKLITTRGFHATPMSLIAEEAGVAAGTIYLYFENKEDLLNQLYLSLKQEYSKALMAGYSPELPVRIAFELVWRNSLNYQLQYLLEFSFMEQFKNSPLIEKVTLQEGWKFFQSASELIDRAREEKIIKDIPADLLVALFFAPITELVKQHLYSQIELSEAYITTAFQGCWDAIKN